MKVTEKDVQYVAELAHLELEPEERARMVHDLNSILEYVDQLRELDTADVPPMAQTSDRFGIDPAKSGTARFAYTMRADLVTPVDEPAGGDAYAEIKRSLPRPEAERNAPESDGTFFKVPKVIER